MHTLNCSTRCRSSHIIYALHCVRWYRSAQTRDRILFRRFFKPFAYHMWSIAIRMNTQKQTYTRYGIECRAENATIARILAIYEWNMAFRLSRWEQIAHYFTTNKQYLDRHASIIPIYVYVKCAVHLRRHYLPHAWTARWPRQTRRWTCRIQSSKTCPSDAAEDKQNKKKTQIRDYTNVQSNKDATIVIVK